MDTLEEIHEIIISIDVPESCSEEVTQIYSNNDLDDKISVYDGKWPKAQIPIDINVDISLNDKDKQTKPLGKYFQLAWQLICIIKEKKYDWADILPEIKIVAKMLQSKFN